MKSYLKPFHRVIFKGHMQRLFWRRGRRCFFLNWLIIIDVKDYVTLSRCGLSVKNVNEFNYLCMVSIRCISGLYSNIRFMTTFPLRVLNIIVTWLYLRLIQIPVLPPHLQIMADLGFANRNPLLLPVNRNGAALRGLIKRYLNSFINNVIFTRNIKDISRYKIFCRSFRRFRSFIERIFGIMKSSYCSVRTRRFHNRRWFGPIVCNVGAALHNRRRMIFTKLRQHIANNWNMPSRNNIFLYDS